MYIICLSSHYPVATVLHYLTEETFYPCGESDAVEALLVGVEEDVVVGANLELEVSLKMWIIADK